MGFGILLESMCSASTQLRIHICPGTHYISAPIFFLCAHSEGGGNLAFGHFTRIQKRLRSPLRFSNAVLVVGGVEAMEGCSNKHWEPKL